MTIGADTALHRIVAACDALITYVPCAGSLYNA